MRRNAQFQHYQTYYCRGSLEKGQWHSPSTEEDSCSPCDSPRHSSYKPSIRPGKEKSQLCKKFIENGFCPYQNKCKFAHGSHQLRKNQQFNHKYKTKQCGVFIAEGCCHFGDRCNFIHQISFTAPQALPHDDGFQLVKAERRNCSRLLALLSQQE